jgi:hypothetical protein
MIKSSLLLVLIFTIFSMQIAFADCSSLSRKFANDDKSLTSMELSMLIKCIEDIKPSNKPSKKQPNQDSLYPKCSTLANKFADNPKSLTEDELTILNQCITHQLEVILNLQDKTPAAPCGKK